jgi:hypothetical protein
MKKMKFLMMLPVAAVTAILAACATTSHCNNDACYDRNVSSVDPYKKGDIATWGTEKKVAEQEEEKEAREPRTPVMRRFER